MSPTPPSPRSHSDAASTSNQANHATTMDQAGQDSGATILHQIVDSVKELYSLPAVALEVVRLTGEPKIDCRKLKTCIEHDPGLTCKILKFVNSPVYGLGRKIADLQEALAILGTTTLKLLVLGFSLPPNLVSGIEKQVLGSYWRMSLTKAITARDLMKHYWNQPGDEAFIGGMLQHVGMLALIQHLGKPYLKFLRRVWNEKESLQKLEVASMGFDHTILSSRLLDAWYLPPHLIRAVGSTPNDRRVASDANETDRLVHVLHLSDLATRLLADEEEAALPQLIEAGERFTGKPLTGLDNVLESVEQQVEQLAELLDIELDDGECYQEVLNRARSRMTELATESLTGDDAADTEPSSSVDTDSGLSDQIMLSQQNPKVTSPDQMVASAEELGDQLAAFVNSDESLASVESASARDNPFLDEPTRMVDFPEYDPDGNSQRESVEVNISALGDPALEGHLSAAVGRCRQHRWGLGLAVIDIDGLEDQLAQLAAEQVYQISQTVSQATQRIFEPEHQFIAVSDSRFAIIFEDVDPEEAGRQLRQLLGGIQEWGKQRAKRRQSAVTLSIGLASMGVPPRNFESPILIERAERCLSTARHFGGDTLKSIVI